METTEKSINWETADEDIDDSNDTRHLNLNYEDFLRSTVCGQRSQYTMRMTFFALFMSIGIIGNLLLLTVILSTRQLRNAPNILICNLAAADLVYIIVTGPIRIENEMNPCWFSGWITCALRNFAPTVCQCACVYSLVALSRERYTAITSSIHSRKQSQIKITIGWAMSTWVFGILFASPILSVKFSYIYIGILCTYIEHGSIAAQVYESTRLLVLYILPVVIISVHYSIMAKTLIKSTNTFQENNASFVKQVKARKRLAYLSIILSICFATFWLPSYIYNLMYNFTSGQFFNNESGTKFRFFHYYMSLANSSLNPWLVFALSTSHRKRLLKCFEQKKETQAEVTGTALTEGQSVSLHIGSVGHRSKMKDSSVGKIDRKDLQEHGKLVTSKLL